MSTQGTILVLTWRRRNNWTDGLRLARVLKPRELSAAAIRAALVEERWALG